VTTSPLENALYLAGLGLRVFPLVPGKKQPAFSGWKDKATTEPTQINDWWGGDYRGYGVGVATGRDLMVLDADVKDGKPGLASLDQMLAEHDWGPSLTVETPSGGRHVYLKVTDGKHIPNVLGTLPGFPGIDIKGDGGFVAAPGSVDAQGRPYKFLPQ
jgi:hypothetical protein